MKNIKVEYSWLKNSAITGINQLPEHSEHYYFDKYVGINQLDYFQIDKMHLNSNWTYMKSDFNEKISIVNTIKKSIKADNSKYFFLIVILPFHKSILI